MSIPDLKNILSSSSLSSSLVTGVTLHRNKPGVFRKIQGQLGYALTFAASIVESAVALVFTILSLLALPISRKPTQQCAKWLSSSAFAAAWSFADFFLNPFLKILVADETSTKQMATSGNLFSPPRDAVI